MRFVFATLAYMAIVFTATAYATEPFSYVANTTGKDAFLSLRTNPSTTTGQRVTTMPNGTLLQVLERQTDGWWRVRIVSSGQEGWALSGANGKVWIECCKAAGANVATSTSLKIGTYVSKDTSCKEISNATMINFDGKKFFGGRFCAAVLVSGTGSTLNATNCANEGEPSSGEVTDTFSVISNSEFGTRGSVYRFCEQADLPQMWRNEVKETAEAQAKRIFKKVRSTIVCWGVGEDYNLEGTPYRANPRVYIRLSPETVPEDVFLDPSVAQAMLRELKTGARTTCRDQLRQQGQLASSIPGMSGSTTIPNAYVVELGREVPFTYIAYSDGPDDKWVIVKNEITGLIRQRRAQTEMKQQAQQQAEALEQAKRRAVQAGLARGRSEIVTAPADVEFVSPIISALRNRHQAGAGIACAETYEFLGGKVSDRSVDGSIGVFLVQIHVVNKSRYPLAPQSWTSGVCGSAGENLNPGQRGMLQVRAVFRKYESGWKFENLGFN